MRLKVQIALSLVALAACLLAVGFSAASFTETQQNLQTISAAADWSPPIAEASAIAQVSGGNAGYIKSKATYYVYAKVVDSGNPASGISSVKANVSVITSGQSTVSLVAGSYSVDGVGYNYRSAQLTAGSLSAGSKSYTLALTDKEGHSASQSFSVAVLGAFAGSSFETANTSGGVEGKPETGDTVSFEFNNPPDPASIVSGWDGSGTKSVSVAIADSAANDTLSVSGATIGGIALGGDYTTGTTTFSGSSISLSESTVTIVLGTAPGSAKTDSGKSKAVWTPSASNYDLAGNTCSTGNITGANKKQF